ncbi:MAG TPA: GIY-YIG nuclease family protein [Sphingomonas sp.]|nr:GIY-YIG nuclease family protein [Sphingomonas sp.]
MTKPGYVYIMTNKRNGTLYIGVTSDLVQRVWQHREGLIEGFTNKYGLKCLVWFEGHADIQDARARELQMKEWRRAWKIKRIEEMNPTWDDLYESLI